jgi:hypothetical protein
MAQVGRVENMVVRNQTAAVGGIEVGKVVAWA